MSFNRRHLVSLLASCGFGSVARAQSPGQSVRQTVESNTNAMPNQLQAIPSEVTTLLYGDLETRVPSSGSIAFITAKMAAETSPIDLRKLDDALPPGSITVVFGNSQQIAHVQALLSATSTVSDGAKTLNDMKAQIATRKSKPLMEAAQELVGLPLYGELRYGNRTLAQFLPITGTQDRPSAIITLPYAGGTLNADNFQLVIHSQPGQTISDGSTTPKALAVARLPELSDLELTALKALPDSQSAMGIGVAAACWGITAVTVAAAAITTCAGCAPNIGKPLTLDPNIILNLGVAGTVGQLVSARRAALEGRSR